jgi:hypothetical protein
MKELPTHILTKIQQCQYKLFDVSFTSIVFYYFNIRKRNEKEHNSFRRLNTDTNNRIRK